MVDSAPTVMVVGSTMIDMISYLDRVPSEGETLFGREFKLGFGGKGANQAVMVALLGGRVAMVNLLGTDAFGQMTLDNFDSFGIDRRFVHTVDGLSSGAAAIWVEPNGANRIVISPGANGAMSSKHVEEAVRGLPTASVTLCQLEIPQDAILAAFKHSRRVGAITILNPAPADEVEAEVLAYTDWLIPNESEFAVMCDGALDGGDDEREFDDLLRELSSRLDLNVVVTLGARGAAYCLRDRSDVVYVPGVPVEAVDTTGAGDAFVGTLSFALARRMEVDAAVAMACLGAATSVTRKGTQTSYRSQFITPQAEV